MKAFYDAHIRPATTTVVVVGDLTGVDLPALLETTLGAWTGTPAAPSVHAPVTADDTGRVIIVDRPGSVQTQLLVGRIGPDRHDDAWAAQILGTYCLGGTLTSRLDRVLREEKGYTYGVRAFAQPLRSAADGSGRAMLAISGSVDTASTAPALADTWTILRTLAAEGLTDAEREEAVQFLVGVAPLKYETAGSVAGDPRGPGGAVPARRLPVRGLPAARRTRHGRRHRGGGRRLPAGPPGHRAGRRRRRDRRPGEEARHR